MNGAATAQPDRSAWPAFAAGFLASLAVVLLIGEAYVRLSPPKDIRQQTGRVQMADERIYQSDPSIGVTFRSYDAFRSANAQVLSELGPLDSPQPTWLWFGNSYIHGPSNLADTALRFWPEVRIFALRKHAILPLRAAEARLLLSQGLRPQRIVFAVMPQDLIPIGKRPLAFLDVTADGAITTRLRWPEPPWTPLVTGSQLVTIAWIRSGRSDGNPSFNPRRIAETPSPRVQDDLLRVFNHLAETSHRYGVPVTVLALPEHVQVIGRAPLGFQDALPELARRAGLDFYDARLPFFEEADKASLLRADRYYTERGFMLVLQGLTDHVRAKGRQVPQVR